MINEDVHELENSGYTLCVALIEKTLGVFGYELRQFELVLKQLMGSLDTVPVKVQDAVFAVVGILPRVTVLSRSTATRRRRSSTTSTSTLSCRR